MDDVILTLENISKSFGSAEVLNGVNISISRGEFITLLGPSGCGKTTTLRIIAGLEQPDGGRVLLEGRDVTGAEPNKRDVNTVFQNYALFPHMNVETNVAYSLRLKRTEKKEMRRIVAEALETVRMSGYEKRMPSELSGGQRQRVAIARAVVNRPKVLLLDEPLGALDLQLRRQMQTELKRLQKELELTFVYITHDQEEALNMSNRVALMRDGVFEQIGTPREIYDFPATSFAARFVGSANILAGTATAIDNGVVRVESDNGSCFAATRGASVSLGDKVNLSVRAEKLKLLSDSENSGLQATVKESGFFGGVLQTTLVLRDGSEITASAQGMSRSPEPGTVLRVAWEPEDAVLVDIGAGL